VNKNVGVYKQNLINIIKSCEEKQKVDLLAYYLKDLHIPLEVCVPQFTVWEPLP